MADVLSGYATLWTGFFMKRNTGLQAVNKWWKTGRFYRLSDFADNSRTSFSIISNDAFNCTPPGAE